MSERFTFFWRTESPFSQWHPSPFTVEGITYACAEQYMMRGKAMLFHDEETAAAIMAANTPGEQKALGRKVRGYEERTWVQHRERIVYAGNEQKFTRNAHLLEALLDTRGTTLVEASPTDTIWGVGLAEEDPRILDRANWRGLNLLGKVLTQLRDDVDRTPGPVCR